MYDHWCLLWGKLQQIYKQTSVCNFIMSVSEITQNKVAEWLTVDSEQWFLWKFHAKVTHTILTYCFKFGTKWKLLQVKHVQGLVHAQISSVMKMKSWQKNPNTGNLLTQIALWVALHLPQWLVMPALFLLHYQYFSHSLVLLFQVRQ